MEPTENLCRNGKGQFAEWRRKVFRRKVLLTLCDVAPAIQIELRAVNAVEDLLWRVADTAIWSVRPDQPDLNIRHVCLSCRGYARP